MGKTRSVRLVGAVLASVALHVGLLYITGGIRVHQYDGRLGMPLPLFAVFVSVAEKAVVPQLQPRVVTNPVSNINVRRDSANDGRREQLSMSKFRVMNGQDIVSIDLNIDRYLPPSRLTAPPGLLHSVKPVSTAYAAMPGVVGELELMVLLSAEGTVDRLVLLENSLPGPIVESIVTAFYSARYRPGVLNGGAVPSRYRIKFALGEENDDGDLGTTKTLPNAHYRSVRPGALEK